MTQRTAIIIGGGPGGLTAAYELLRRSDVHPIVLEATDTVGGISQTANFGGNRIDIGGHRFFSKSDRVMRWWLDILPPQAWEDDGGAVDVLLGGPERAARYPRPDPETTDETMLIRSRVSRILYGGKLFSYPLSLSVDTVLKMGLFATARHVLSYLKSVAFPRRPEKSLEDFLINRFGYSLYSRFFREYTEKVWGVPCTDISPEWGAQRIKGLSIRKVLAHAAKRLLPRKADLAQRNVETSLIERFLYPKFGPGQMWEVVTDKVRAMGGEVRMNTAVTGLVHDGKRVTGAIVRDTRTGAESRLDGDLFISTMPVKALIEGLDPPAPEAVKAVAGGLLYRDFRTAGLLVDRLELGGGVTARELSQKVPDNWIYIQEPGVKVGRLQIFNNWSPYMVRDPNTILIGLEYFCTVGDPLWELDDATFLDLAVAEMDKLKIVRPTSVLDRYSVRMPKAYPAYFGTYDSFPQVRDYVDGFDNLYLVGRNGMHRYNNQDHSMLAAMTAVDSYLTGTGDKERVWSVNTEQDYHEEKAAGSSDDDPDPGEATARAAE